MRILPILAIVLSLAACGQRPRDVTPGLDTELLDRDFAPLAERAQPGVLNAAVQNLETGSAWSWNADQAMPMQSVFKVVLGAAVLAAVDRGQMQLTEVITVAPKDLSPGGAVTAAFPGRDHYTVEELLTLAVGQSDNTAADLLMKRIGGPGAVTAWLEEKSLHGIRVDRYERELQMEVFGLASFRPEWVDPAALAAARESIPPEARRAAMNRYLADPRDTMSTEGALEFLARLKREELLSAASTARLLRIMTASMTAPGRLRANLPAGATLAHKSGSSGTDLGLTPATNDIGIVTLRNGHRYAVAVFLTGSTATDAQRDAAIADAARLIGRAVK